MESWLKPFCNLGIILGAAGRYFDSRKKELKRQEEDLEGTLKQKRRRVKRRHHVRIPFLIDFWQRYSLESKRHPH